MVWRDKVPASIKSHLESQIRESSRYKRIYLNSKNPSNSQLWIAIANLSKQILDLNLKLKFLEEVIKNSLQKQKNSPLIKKQKNKKAKKISSLKKTLKKY